MCAQGVVAIIPARGGSRRLPRKNIYPFFGRTLLEYAIAAARESKHINRGIYVSTDDREIADTARRLGALVIDRPAHLAQDQVWTQEVLKHAVRYLEGAGIDFNTIARLYCSPYIESSKIDEALQKLDTHRLWEVFSVNQEGIEDAVLHVLRKDCVWQEALSVYKAVVQTNYQDVHTQADILQAEQARIDHIERETRVFLQQLADRNNHRSLLSEIGYILGRSQSLWQWQLKVPLAKRWQTILQHSPQLAELLRSSASKDLRVLDLGSGFGMYWPILREYGVKKFVGVDLFDIRAPQDYYRAAQAYSEHFCPDCETQLIMDDVRNLDKHSLRFSQFDIIFNIATASTKAGSTTIPHPLLAEIVQQYGATHCVAVHIENIP